MNETKKKWYSKIDPWTFFPPLIATLLISITVMTNPAKAGEFFNSMFSFTTTHLTWWFEWIYAAVFIALIVMCFLPIGKKKLGEGKPEYSNLSWWGMLFTCPAGLGLLTWGTIEWFYYADAPMWGMEKGAPDTLTLAKAVPLYHWGAMAICMYVLFGIVMGHYMYNKKEETASRPSTACVGAIGEKNTKGLLGKIIDMLLVVGLLLSVVTCIGVNVPTVFGLLGAVTGFQPGLGIQSSLIVMWSVVMALLLWTGLKKGIKFLSDSRVIAGYIVCAIILILGPTTRILDGFTDTIGALAHNFVRLMFNADAIAGSHTPQNWTTFYNAWNMALALPNGLFYAKISKGRTIREFILGIFCAVSIGSYIFFAVLTNFSMITAGDYAIDLGKIIAEQGQGVAIVEIWKHLPLAKIMIPVLLLLALVFMQTLLNSNAYSMAMATSRKLKENEEPAKWLRVFWSLCFGAVAISLLLIGGIKPAQTLAVVAGIPGTIVAVLLFVSFIKDIKKEKKERKIVKTIVAGTDEKLE